MEISSRTIIFTVFLIILLQVLWLVKEVIFSFFIAFIIMSALNPLVTNLQNKRIPRGLSSLIIFVILFTVLGYIFAWIIPPVVAETTLLFKNLPKIVSNINPNFSQYFDINLLTRYFPTFTSNAFEFLKNLFSNIIFVVSTIFFSFYFLVEEGALKKFIAGAFERQQALKVTTAIEKAERRMRAWFWGELTLMVIIGILTYIGLSLLNVRYAISLALIAGLLEIVPVLGPVLSAVPAFIIASSGSYFLGLAVIALYFIVQQLENQVVVPLVMKRAVGLNPIATLAALIIGGKLAGFFGVLLAIPITLFVETLLIEFSKSKE